MLGKYLHSSAQKNKGEKVIMITSKNFSEYIDFLRKNFNNVIEYKERTGTLESGVLKIWDGLFDEDPFIVFNASIAAAAVLGDGALYH